MENLTFAPLSSKVTAELARLSTASRRVASSSSKSSLQTKVVNAMLTRHVTTNPWGHAE